MTDHQSSFETPSLEIDHPARPGWFTEGLALMVSPEEFARKLGAISVHLDSKRADHELANIHVLRAAAEGVVSPEALDEYKDLADRPELVGRYIIWFGRVTTAAYDNVFRLQEKDSQKYADLVRSVRKEKHLRRIGLDLGGWRNLDNWEGTADLDRYASGMSDAIKAEDSNIEVTECKTPAEQMRGYKLYPVTISKDGFPQRDLTAATIRRSRRHLIVRKPGLRQLLVVKESTGLIPIEGIKDEREAEVIGEALNNWSKENHGYENSPVAQVAGRVFERAITNRDEVIPINAHYYVLASVDMPVVPS